MASKRSSGPSTVGVGPWLGVRSIADPYAIPPNYLSDASNVYIADGKGGSGAYARPGFRKVVVLAPSPPETDALVRGQLVWMDHLSAGKAQSIGDDRSTQSHKFGRYWDRSADSAFSYSATGGRVGGGYLEALTDNAFLEMQGGANQVSIITQHDLRGITPAEFKALQSFGVHSRIGVLPNLTLQAQRWVAEDTWEAYDNGTSTVTVPATGVFALETQVGQTPSGYRVGGFSLTNLYIDGGPVLGFPAIRVIGSPTNPVSTNPPGPAHAILPLGSRLHGYAFIAPEGPVARWYYDIMLAAAMPFADGTVIGSSIGHAHSEVYGHDVDSNPQTITTNLIWGVSDRWRNVISTTHSAYEGDEPLTLQTAMGFLSPATNRWLNPDTGLSDGMPFVPTSDTVVRNTLYGAVADFYRVQLNVTRAPVELVAIGPFALVGFRLNQGTYNGSFGAPTTSRIPWMFTGPKPAVTMNYIDPIGAQHHAYTLALKMADDLILAGRGGQALAGEFGAIGSASAWRALVGYQLNPPTLRESDPAGRPWTVTALPQVGIQGDFSALDAINGLAAGDRWLQVDVGQMGLDVAYRTSPIPALTVPVRPPLVDLTIASQSIPTGTISVYDGSVDFNGTKDQLITGIATRVLNWGDGSAPVTLAGGGSGHAVSHTYAAQGVDNTITLTVTNALGIIATQTMVFSPLGTLTADFAAVIDSDGDPTGKTADFTDASTLTLGTIVSRSWDFGDGGTSTTTNPTHVYAGYATYTVVLTVTDNLGRHTTHSEDVEITEPVIGGGGCGLTTAALTTPNPAGVMADDFAGGNARFINYLSSTNLRNYVWSGSPYRGLYNTRLGHSSTDYELDTVVTFNGRPSMKFNLFGDGYGAMSSTYTQDTTNLGDDATFADVAGVWFRMIFKLDAVMRTLLDPISVAGRGLKLFVPSSPSTFTPLILANGGHLYQQVDTRLTLDAGQTTRQYTDLGRFDAAADGDWAELIGFISTVDGTSIRNMAWMGAACSLASASPTIDASNVAHYGHSGGGFLQHTLQRNLDWLSYFNAGAATFSPMPAVNVSLIEIQNTRTAADNPFGVSLT